MIVDQEGEIQVYSEARIAHRIDCFIKVLPPQLQVFILLDLWLTNNLQWSRLFRIGGLGRNYVFSLFRSLELLLLMNLVLLVIVLKGEESDLGKSFVEELLQILQEVARYFAYFRLKLCPLSLAPSTIQVIVVPPNLLFLVDLAYFKLFIMIVFLLPFDCLRMPHAFPNRDVIDMLVFIIVFARIRIVC